MILKFFANNVKFEVSSLNMLLEDSLKIDIALLYISVLLYFVFIFLYSGETEYKTHSSISFNSTCNVFSIEMVLTCI